MDNHVYKTIELTGTSPRSMEDAVKSAVERASQTLSNLSWFQVVDTRGNVRDGKVHHWQVVIKVGFLLSDTAQDKEARV
ncbi:MAG: dodecin family protein [Verrucomicrobiota bacterium JB022]|nr:dodecin family protein [Verrucomicrobiota bacterium JB022]